MTCSIIVTLSLNVTTRSPPQQSPSPGLILSFIPHLHPPPPSSTFIPTSILHLHPPLSSPTFIPHLHPHLHPPLSSPTFIPTSILHLHLQANLHPHLYPPPPSSTFISLTTQKTGPKRIRHAETGGGKMWGAQSMKASSWATPSVGECSTPL